MPKKKKDHMIVGFTGTQIGMTPFQLKRVRKILTDLAPKALHHGDCVGADAEAHEIALSLDIPIIGHPPLKSSKQAFCRGFEELRDPKPYLERNHDIVDECHVLIAAPATPHQRRRSGTWATYRYAHKTWKPTYLVYPIPQEVCVVQTLYGEDGAEVSWR